MQVLVFCELGFKTPIHAPEVGVFGRQNKGKGGAMLTLTNSFLLLGVVTSVPLLAKMDQEMRPLECRQTDTHCDRDKLNL